MKIENMADERFIMHRFKATRLATMVGMILIFVFFTYYIVVEKTIRWEFLVILASVAATKLAAMYYYRKTN